MNDPETTTDTSLTTSSVSPTTTSTGSTTTGTKPKTRAVQNQRIQNFITEASQAIATAKQDNQLLLTLTALGYDEAELTTGEDLALTAQNSFTLRQQALGNLDAAHASIEATAKIFHDRCTDFRDVVRLAFTDSASLQALGVSGKLPFDRQSLITKMRASFATAAQEPYATALTRRSYGIATLATATAELTALDTALSTRAMVVQQAVAATTLRDSDYKALKTWMTGFQRALIRAKKRLA